MLNKKQFKLFNQNIPNYIYELYEFWIWDFPKKELDSKISEVYNIMKSRTKANSPKVTIVVPAHKEEKYILWTLKSLALQSFEDVEFLIVVNWEERNSLTEIIAKSSWFNVVYEKTPWISNARDIWLRNANWKIIINTDADTIHEKEWVSNIIKLMETKNIQYWAWFSRMITKNQIVFHYHELMGMTHFLKQKAWNKFVTWFCEADSFFYKDIAIKAWWWDGNIRLAEWIDIFKRMEKIHKNDFLYIEDGIINYTSARRYDWQSILKHAFLANYNWILLSLWIKPNVDEDVYPNIR